MIHGVLSTVSHPQYSKPTQPTPWLEAYPYAEGHGQETAYLGEILAGMAKDTGLGRFGFVKQSPADSLKNQNLERP